MISTLFRSATASASRLGGSSVSGAVSHIPLVVEQQRALGRNASTTAAVPPSADPVPAGATSAQLASVRSFLESACAEGDLANALAAMKQTALLKGAALAPEDLEPLVEAAAAIERKGAKAGGGREEGREKKVAESLRHALVERLNSDPLAQEADLPSSAPLLVERINAALLGDPTRKARPNPSLRQAHDIFERALDAAPSSSSLLALSELFKGAGRVLVDSTSGKGEDIQLCLAMLRRCVTAFHTRRRRHRAEREGGEEEAEDWKALQSLVMRATDRLIRLGKLQEATLPFNILTSTATADATTSPDGLARSSSSPPFSPSTSTFNLAIQSWVLAHERGLVKADQAMTQVAQLVTMMQGGGGNSCAPDASTFNLYLKLLCDSSGSNLTEALNVPRMMSEAGIQPNDLTFATMHKGFLTAAAAAGNNQEERRKRKEEADQLVRVMISSGRRPTAWILANRLKAACFNDGNNSNSAKEMMAEARRSIALIAQEEEGEDKEKEEEEEGDARSASSSTSLSSSAASLLVNRVVLNILIQAFALTADRMDAALYLYHKMMMTMMTAKTAASGTSNGKASNVDDEEEGEDSKAVEVSRGKSSSFIYPAAGPDTFRTLALALLKKGYFSDAVEALLSVSSSPSPSPSPSPFLDDDSYAVVARSCMIAGASRLGLLPYSATPPPDAPFYRSHGWFSDPTALAKLAAAVDEQQQRQQECRQKLAAEPANGRYLTKQPLALRIFPDESAWSAEPSSAAPASLKPPAVVEEEGEAESYEGVLRSLSSLLSLATKTRPVPLNHLRGQSFAHLRLETLAARVEALKRNQKANHSKDKKLEEEVSAPAESRKAATTARRSSLNDVKKRELR